MNLTLNAKRFWTDDHGFIISAELVIIATVLVIGLIVGLSEVQSAVVHELNDVSCAIGRLNQSYFIRGFTGCKAATFGTFFNDLPDACDYCNVDLCSGSAVFAGEGVGYGGGSFSGAVGGGSMIGGGAVVGGGSMIYGGSGSSTIVNPVSPAPVVGPSLAPATTDCPACPAPATTSPAPATTNDCTNCTPSTLDVPKDATPAPSAAPKAGTTVSPPSPVMPVTPVMPKSAEPAPIAAPGPAKK